jgi:hypothetical protein
VGRSGKRVHCIHHERSGSRSVKQQSRQIRTIGTEQKRLQRSHSLHRVPSRRVGERGPDGQLRRDSGNKRPARRKHQARDQYHTKSFLKFRQVTKNLFPADRLSVSAMAPAVLRLPGERGVRARRLIAASLVRPERGLGCRATGRNHRGGSTYRSQMDVFNALWQLDEQCDY